MDIGKKKTKNNGSTGPAIAFSTALGGMGIMHTAQVIVFDHVILNEGGGYDVSSGKFTCPKSGMYLITFFIGYSSNHSSLSQFVASLVVNNASIIEAQVEGHFDWQDLQGGNAAVVKLDKNDMVWVQQFEGKLLNSRKGRTSSFSGVLLYPLD